MAMIVVTAMRLGVSMVDDAGIRMSVRAAMMHTVIGVIISTRRRSLAGEARPRAGQRDNCRQDGAEQRQEDNRLIHRCPVSPS